MKNLINNLNASRLHAQEMQYVIGGMNNQGQPQAGSCARKIIRDVVVTVASDELRKAARNGAKSDYFKEFKENCSKAWQELADNHYTDLQLKYPSIQRDK